MITTEIQFEENNYRIVRPLSNVENNEVFIVSRQADGFQAILKRTHILGKDLHHVSRLSQEYEILKKLEHPSLPKVFGFSFDGYSAILLEEYFNGPDLKGSLIEGTFTIAQTLEIAIQLAAILDYLQHNGVIHKNICPSSVILTEGMRVKLIDFRMASKLQTDSKDVLTLDQIEGAISYISPEQTGRTAYSVTHTSDFYSLGILLYQLLAGKLPFDSIDPLETIHFHLSRQPLPLNEVVSGLPEGLGQIVNKLLKKNPDDRYQTAAGLLDDLQLVSNSYNAGKELTNFVAGETDFSGNYQQTQKLYGRDYELNLLLKYFNQLYEVKSSLVLVSGYSGVGKSALIKHLKFPVIQQHGMFVSGKFDQFKKDIPFFAFIEAIGDFIKKLLTESDEVISVWKERISQALGSNAKLITDVIPLLSLIIENPPPVPKLQPAQQESRFNKVLLDFVYSLSTSQNPLVLFLDDLQWADHSSLNLIKRIIQNPGDNNLLIIGAYRNNEVSQGHPLLVTIEQLSGNKNQIEILELSPLNEATTVQITKDSFGMKDSKAAILGGIVFTKTKGNPFFIHSFLKALYKKRILKYDPIEKWTYDVAEIESLEYTANVVDLMTNSLVELPKETQNSLMFAAVLGNSFNIVDLSNILEKTESEVYQDILPGIEGGFLRFTDSNYSKWALKTFHTNNGSASEMPASTIGFEFSHDKVHQATYQLVPESERALKHLKTGRLLLKNRDENQIQEDIFEVLNHFVFCHHLLTDKDERLKISKLCLLAGKKALESTSYNLGVRYLNIGKDLLEDNSWEKNFEHTYELFMALGENQYLNNNPEIAESYFKKILGYSKTNFEKLKVYYLHSSLYLKEGNTNESLRLGLEAAKLYNIHFPKSRWALFLQANLTIVKYLILLSTRYKDSEKLIQFEDCEDEEMIAFNKFLIDLATSAYQQNQFLMMLVIFKIVKLYLKHGYTDASFWGFAGISVIVLSGLDMQKKGFDLWEITNVLHQRSLSPTIKWRGAYTINNYFKHRKYSYRKNHDDIVESFKACVLNGDPIFAAYSASLILKNLFNAGENLNKVLLTAEPYIPSIKSTKAGYDFFEIFYQMTKSLSGKIQDGSWDDAEYSDSETIKRLEEEGNKTKLAFYYSAKCNYYYLLGDYKRVLKESKTLEMYAESFLGDQQEAVHMLYASLAIAACLDELEASEKKANIKFFKSSLRKTKMYADGCPQNFSQQYQLLLGEDFAMQGNFLEALRAFAKAVELAKKNLFPQVEAIANQRMAKLYAKQGLPEQSNFYLLKAWKKYQEWGADYICDKLKESNPQLFAAESNAQIDVASKSPISTIASKTNLDIATLFKASQSIASQVKYEDLLKSLMQITIENAGAERGCLLLFKKDQLCIEAVGISGSTDIDRYESVPYTELSILPESIITYCRRTKEVVVVDDALEDDRFNGDGYVKENKLLSVLCMPISAGGGISGLLYLDNKLIKGVFNKNKIDVLKMLSGQIGISIDNSLMYSDLESKVKERTSEIQKTYEKLEKAHNNLKAAQSQLVQQEKLASLGQLTAGIAHEIKNPLNFVNNFSEVSLELVEEALEEIEKIEKNVHADESREILEDVKTNLRKIHEHGSRANSIVESMLMHSRGGSGKMEPEDLNQLVSQYVNLSFHGMRSAKNPINVEIQLELDNEIGKIPLKSEDFSRVIINLCNNAFDAMRSKTKIESHLDYLPKLLVRTERVKKGVNIFIVDNGPGVPKEIVDQILQPFFTTKKGTEGTGLGLSISNDIVKSHGGSLSLSNNQDQPGAIFTIFIPAINP